MPISKYLSIVFRISDLGRCQKLFVISSLSIPAQFYLAFHFATVNQHYGDMVSSRADKIATISIREVSR